MADLRDMFSEGMKEWAIPEANLIIRQASGYNRLDVVKREGQGERDLVTACSSHMTLDVFLNILYLDLQN